METTGVGRRGAIAAAIFTVGIFLWLPLRAANAQTPDPVGTLNADSLVYYTTGGGNDRVRLYLSTDADCDRWHFSGSYKASGRTLNRPTYSWTAPRPATQVTTRYAALHCSTSGVLSADSLFVEYTVQPSETVEPPPTTPADTIWLPADTVYLPADTVYIELPPDTVYLPCECDTIPAPPPDTLVSAFPMDSTVSLPRHVVRVVADSAGSWEWALPMLDTLPVGSLLIPVWTDTTKHEVSHYGVTYSGGVGYACDVQATVPDSLWWDAAPEGMAQDSAWKWAVSGDRWRETRLSEDETAMAFVEGGAEVIEPCGEIAMLGSAQFDAQTPPEIQVIPNPVVCDTCEVSSQQMYLGAWELPTTPQFSAGGRVTWGASHVEAFRYTSARGSGEVEGYEVVIPELQPGDWFCVRDARVPADGEHQVCNSWQTAP